MWGRKIITGIVDEALRNHGWPLLIDPRIEQHRLEILEGRQGKGIIMSLRDEELATHVEESQLPVVNVASWGMKCKFESCVVTDDEAHAEMAYCHPRAKGRTSFGFYSPIEHAYLMTRRRKFIELVRQSKMQLSTYQTPNKAIEHQEIPTAWLTQLATPSAILAANPEAALQLTELCRGTAFASFKTSPFCPAVPTF
ncbi:MAG: hypothetical protein VXZ82_13720 [Planctomycetota bacterium]|nr:hypothetical protein [Planctomycetota bacterium]